jgi:NAD(P)-dependent dehydrogenase (short-subunit alcohol dehydrogenase family)
MATPAHAGSTDMAHPGPGWHGRCSYRRNHCLPPEETAMSPPNDQTMPAQEQPRQPGREHRMSPEPEVIRAGYRGSGRLEGKCALITGGDSGIGRAVAVHFAREGADVAIAYLDENDDAEETRRLVEAEGRRCLLFSGDLGSEAHCRGVVEAVVEAFGRIDVLVNNAAEQHEVDEPEALQDAQLRKTFQTNVFSFFHLTSAALPSMGRGASIINSSSITGVRGHKTLIDYAATKGAILSMTYSLAQSLAERGIRVNAVAPGPIWTPLIPASFDAEHVARFGKDTLFKRPGQPSEVAPAYVFLASDDASFVTGEVLHVNGGSNLAH